ncbi:MAG: PepSY-associated TM helix domain-containing protein [Hyphomonadaceae bacterium]|nr:PepSY-associated TM helix domain-containing protein [Hyphomonadaceae bacterium]
MIKARLIRYLFAIHRWMGVTLGLLMLLWCLTGVVMIWNPYPSTTLDDRDYRVEGLAPVSAPDVITLPAIPDAAPVSSARIEMLGARPVLSLAWSEGEEGKRGLYDLANAAPVEQISEAEALDVARTYVERHKLKGAPAFIGSMERDEFVVAGYFNSRRPFHQVALKDKEDTVLYISSKTGEVSQRTTGSQRVWTWLGAIPHWLFFTELRRNTPLWTQVIIWTSLAGCFLTLTGLFVGLRQFRRRKSTNKFASPYRGVKFWHHMTGLVFGVLVLTFSFSGFTSMQPWGWLENIKASGEAAERYSGSPVTWAQLKPALEAQAAALRTVSRERSTVAMIQLEGQPWFIWQSADGSRRRLDASGQPAPFDDAARQRATNLLGSATARFETMTVPDEYYYPGASSSDLPAVRIVGEGDTRFYLDPDTGAVRFIADDGAKGFRVLHMALHTFDFVGSPLREILLVLAMIGVTAVCAFGVWMGARKIARGGKLDNLPADEPPAA